MMRAAAIVLLSAGVCFSANRYIRDGGSGSTAGTGNCADWTTTNACDTLPATLVRGDTYYIADGAYGAMVLNTAVSGSTVITLKKATIADHGTATGWVDTYGDGQAVWGKVTVSTSYWNVDGASRSSSSNWDGAATTYGLRFIGGGSNGRAIELVNAIVNITFRYVDATGGGEDTGDGDDVVYGLNGPTNVIFQYSSLRDSDRTIFLQRGCWQDMVVEYSFLGRNNSTPAVHGELLSDTCSDGTVFRYNIIEDIEGTAVWAVLNGTGGKSASNTADGWKIYGNWIRVTAVTEDDVFAGVIYVANDGSNSNWMDNLQYYNNTHTGGIVYFLIYIQATGTGNVSKNNVYYDAGGTSNGYGPSLPTFENNWYYNTANSADGGAGVTVCSTNCGAYFVSAKANMRLAQALAGGSLGGEFNADMDGNTRGADGTWDRGAFEYAAGGATTSSRTGGGIRTTGRLQ